MPSLLRQSFSRRLRRAIKTGTSWTVCSGCCAPFRSCRRRTWRRTSCRPRRCHPTASPRRRRYSSTRVGTRQARGMGTPKANYIASPRRRRCSSTRVGTRQARGMDTPKASKLRHEEVVTAARVGTRQARGDGYPESQLASPQDVAAARG